MCKNDGPFWARFAAASHMRGQARARKDLRINALTIIHKHSPPRLFKGTKKCPKNYVFQAEKKATILRYLRFARQRRRAIRQGGTRRQVVFVPPDGCSSRCRQMRRDSSQAGGTMPNSAAMRDLSRTDHAGRFAGVG